MTFGMSIPLTARISQRQEGGKPPWHYHTHTDLEDLRPYYTLQQRDS